jgi:tight adherence protein B
MIPFLLFGLLLFLAVALGLAGLLQHREGATLRAVRSRLQNLGERPAEVQRHQVERDRRFSSIGWLDRLLQRVDLAQRLDMLIFQAGMNMRAGVLLLLIVTCAAGGYIAGLMLFHRVIPALLGLAVCGSIPLLYVKWRKGQRMRAFAEEFPDALDLLVSALRAGLSFTAAMQIVAEECPQPVRGEFAITVEEQSLGLDFRESLVNLSKRVDSIDLKFFVTAIILQRETGGNLVEVLESTARLIRDRFRILGDIQTFTAQGRLTGAILSALPICIGLFSWAMAPEYFKPMVESPAGRAALCMAGLMQLGGALVIRRIVDVKV